MQWIVSGYSYEDLLRDEVSDEEEWENFISTLK